MGTKIKQLGVGAQFTIPGYANDAVFKIIGRARPSGGANHVKAVHVPGGPNDPDTFNAKYFDIEKEVVVVAKATRTVDAIDSRDQPEDVETIDQVAAREGIALGQ